MLPTLSSYYPLYQLIYQSTVFLSRSSISIGFPALPQRWLSAPAVVQGVLTVVLGVESAVGWGVFGAEDGVSEDSHIWFVMGCIALEGVCGGLA